MTIKNNIPDLKVAEEVLTWAIANNDNIVLATSLGKQTLIIIDMLWRMGISIPIIYIDTGFLFKETYELRNLVEEKYKIRIRPVKPKFENIRIAEEAHGDHLWSTNPDLCCNIRKVIPLREYLIFYDAWITGIRRDQSSTRQDIKSIEYDDSHGLLKINPLAYWNIDMVNEYIEKHNVPYNPLHDEGYKSIGCFYCTAKTNGKERDGRWPGFNKTECGIHNLFKKDKSEGE